MLDDLAARTAKAIGDLPANFMLDAATYEYGNALGFDGLDFYHCGRGGCLGDVDAGVVAAAFVFFNPDDVRTRWENGRKVMAPPAASREFAGCLYRWSAEHLDPSPDYARLAHLLGTVVERASPAGAPLFAGWRTLPEPSDPRELTMHRLNALRELRGALHGACVLAAGLDPLVAVLVKTPFMATIFGWPEPYPEVELARDRWAEAEAATNRAMGTVLASLDEADRQELAELLDQVHSGIH